MKKFSFEIEYEVFQIIDTRFSLFKLTKKIFEKMFQGNDSIHHRSVLTLMVYLPRVFANNEKVFSFHYFYLRNKILTLKFLNFFKNCIISMINFKNLEFFII